MGSCHPKFVNGLLWVLSKSQGACGHRSRSSDPEQSWIGRFVRVEYRRMDPERILLMKDRIWEEVGEDGEALDSISETGIDI